MRMALLMIGSGLLLLAARPALAREHRSGGAGKYTRPAMAARAHMGGGFLKRARTVGISPDGKQAYVVATDRDGEIWNIEVNRSTGRNTSQLKLVKHYSLQDARFFATRWEKGVPSEFIAARPGDAGRGLPVLTNSHKNMRVTLPSVLVGSPEVHVLIGTEKRFPGAWKSVEQNVRFDPVDRIPSQRGTLLK